MEDGATLLGGALRPHRDLALVRPIDDDVAQALGLVRARASRLLEELRKAGRASDGARNHDVGGRKRLCPTQSMTSAKFWSCPTATSPGWKVLSMAVLRVAPIDVGGLHERLWKGESALRPSSPAPPSRRISASGLGFRLVYDEIDVGSPPRKDEALLYCPAHPPDPGRPVSKLRWTRRLR